MRKVLLSSGIMLALVFIFRTSNAQVSLSVNIGVQPEWGPEGYDYVDYYYMPQYEAYYYVPERKFVYLDGSRWIFATALPPRFGTVNLFSTYKVVINEPKAYMHFNDDKVKYVKYKGGGKQVVIRDSKDPKYAEARKHPDNSKAAPAHNDTKAAPAHNNAKAQPDHSNTKGKEDKKEKHPEGGGEQPH
jgi:hypothetical protein